MEFTKGDIKYTITERAHDWKVVSHISESVHLNFEISKQLCMSIDELKRYINENDMFAR